MADEGEGAHESALGQLEVDVLERRLRDGEAVELDLASHRPLGQLVERAGRARRCDLDVAALHRDASLELRQLGVGRQCERDPRRGLRPAAELVRRALGDDQPVADDRDPIGEVLRLVHVVGGEEDGLSELAEARDDLPRLAASRRVEAGGGLVEEEQLGVADERHCDVETALLAAGELAGAIVRLALEPDEGDRLVDVARGGVVAGVELERLAHGEERLDAALLEDDPDALPPSAVSVLRVDAQDADLARAPLAIALEDLDRGRLPGAVGPEEREDLAGGDRQVDAADGLVRAVRLAQAADLDRVHGRPLW